MTGQEVIEQKTIEGNKLIDTFMGGYRHSKKFDYRTKWDDLMPVIEKIESFHLLVGITTDSCYITSRGVEDELLPWLAEFPENEFYEDVQWRGDGKLFNAWMVCVRFIKWHNSKTV
jgi:hypothetical protein